jgi:hypothetical protein
MSAATNAVTSFPPLRAGGFVLEGSADTLGWLRDSSNVVEDGSALRQQLAEDGYVLIRGALDRQEVLEARREVTRRLAELGLLDPAHDPMDAVALKDPPNRGNLMRTLTVGNEPLHKVLYAGRMIEILRRLLATDDVRHFDYTWFRAVSPGKGTPPHCDSVYMNRGTLNLYTAWTPIGDCTLEMGGLMILEGSVHNRRLRQTYAARDVDSYCTNKTGNAAKDAWERGKGGVLSCNPARLRRGLGGRWLTSEFRAGDVLIFSIFTVHASLDNHSRHVRLSSDSRYQPASEPADERWIGANPPAHGKAARRGRIC